MHWVEVDSYPLPKRIGGHAVLDFCNTWAGWAGLTRCVAGTEPDPRREWLPTYDRFAVWSGYAELLSPADVRRIRLTAEDAPRSATAVLSRAHELRELLYRLLLDPADEAALAGFVAVAQYAVRATILVTDPDGRVRRRLPESVGMELPLLAVARAAEELLADSARHTARACPGDDCGWLFLDLRGRRRWCDMGVCGNRAKVRAHAARQSR